jgi:hypothetical protein
MRACCVALVCVYLLCMFGLVDDTQAQLESRSNLEPRSNLNQQGCRFNRKCRWQYVMCRGWLTSVLTGAGLLLEITWWLLIVGVSMFQLRQQSIASGCVVRTAACPAPVAVRMQQIQGNSFTTKPQPSHAHAFAAQLLCSIQ